MKPIHIACILSALLAACSSNGGPTPTEGALGFETADITGWRAGSTGGTGMDATWRAQADKGAVSAPNVLSLVTLNHEAEDRYNVLWNEKLRFANGKLSVSVRADGGEVDQGGGPMWRVQDANNYYICRFNPLESNYRVYVVKDGKRRQLATALSEVKAGEWHRIEVEHVGDHITCRLDGKKLLDTTDATIPAEGGVGFWTKADARTSFDDLLVQPAAK